MPKAVTLLTLGVITRRRYVMAWIECQAAESLEMGLADIVGSDLEACFSVIDRLDDVLDLRVGERLQIRFNRDNTDSEGFIKRIK